MNKLILSITASTALATEGDGKCRALALSGGSNHALWEAGVIWGLLHYGDPADFAWDVISGISAGALNTGLMSVWATGDEYAMSEHLSDLWASIEEEGQLFMTWDGKMPSVENVIASLPYAFENEIGLVNDQNGWDLINGAT